jgi:hypothetical protein
MISRRPLSGSQTLIVGEAKQLAGNRDDEEHAEQAITIARKGCDDDDNGRAHVLFGYLAFRSFGTEGRSAEELSLA